MGHPENYRWCNIARSRFDSIRINVEMASIVLGIRRHFVEDTNKVKIAPHISHSVYPK